MAQSRYNKMQGDEESVTVRLRKMRPETDKAWLFQLVGERRAVWLPLSEISVNDTNDSAIKLVDMPLWLAKKTELEDYAE